VGVQIFFSETGAISYGHRGDMLIGVVPNLVCGVWLFLNVEKHGLNKWLWRLFGIGAHLFSVILFFIERTYNQALNNRTAATQLGD